MRDKEGKRKTRPRREEEMQENARRTLKRGKTRGNLEGKEVMGIN